MNKIIRKEFNEHIISAQLLHELTDGVAHTSKLCIDSLNQGGKILLFGNGGSASDAQHIAAELVGRFKISRKGLPAIALNTDSSVLTSIANDFGYEFTFARQIEAIANFEDIVIGISTSGNSMNVINALLMASKLGCNTIGLSGKDGGKMNSICDVNLNVPSSDTPRIQELHMIIGHTICHLIDQAFKD
jgi:D-sedoheptulose 7-phosphate isomerase